MPGQKKHELHECRVADLIPYANNSRVHSDEQVAQVAASIQEYGFTNPVLIDEDNGVIAGHGRLQAAKKLGMDVVPCITLKGLTKAQKKAYVIVDNSLALNASWNEELLRLEVQSLKELDYDLDLLGLDNIGDLLIDPGAGKTDDDDVPDIPETAITETGDIWLLGEHRLVCGDSTYLWLEGWCRAPLGIGPKTDDDPRVRPTYGQQGAPDHETGGHAGLPDRQ